MPSAQAVAGKNLGLLCLQSWSFFIFKSGSFFFFSKNVLCKCHLPNCVFSIKSGFHCLSSQNSFIIKESEQKNTYHRIHFVHLRFKYMQVRFFYVSSVVASWMQKVLESFCSRQSSWLQKQKLCLSCRTLKGTFRRSSRLGRDFGLVLWPALPKMQQMLKRKQFHFNELFPTLWLSYLNYNIYIFLKCGWGGIFLQANCRISCPNNRHVWLQ